MTKHIRWLGAAALAAAIGLAGCGGGGGDGALPVAAPDIAGNVEALIDFMKSLIAGSSETSEPIAVDALTLAVDDTAEPAPL